VFSFQGKYARALSSHGIFTLRRDNANKLNVKVLCFIFMPGIQNIECCVKISGWTEAALWIMMRTGHEAALMSQGWAQAQLYNYCVWLREGLWSHRNLVKFTWMFWLSIVKARLDYYFGIYSMQHLGWYNMDSLWRPSCTKPSPGYSLKAWWLKEKQLKHTLWGPAHPNAQSNAQLIASGPYPLPREPSILWVIYPTMRVDGDW
jgi:hypothetical protein